MVNVSTFQAILTFRVILANLNDQLNTMNCFMIYYTCTIGYGVGGWKFKKLLKAFDTGQFLCKNEF